MFSIEHLGFESVLGGDWQNPIFAKSQYFASRKFNRDFNGIFREFGDVSIPVLYL